MKGILSKIFIFAIGAGIGSAVTYKVLKTKYDALIQEEIDSIKEQFTKVYSEDEPTESVDEEKDREVVPEKVAEFIEYSSIIRDNGYTNYSSNKKETEVNDVEKPYVISPDEFGEIYGYETIDLTYYSDGVLTDDQDEIIDDVEAIVGLDALERFGEYEEDAIHVRNDRLKCDYEILLDNKPYSGTDR